MTNEMMIFVAVCAVLLALCILALAAPLWRGADTPDTPARDIEIYRDQLAEIDRDVGRGTLDPDEAERVRTEVSRRLLAADATAGAAPGRAPRATSRAVVMALAVALVAAAGYGYYDLGAPGYRDLPRAERIAAGELRRAERPTQAEAEATVPQDDAITRADPQTREILQSLRAAAFERPGDLQAWTYLTQVEASVGNLHRAARAQETLIELKGDAVTDADFVDLMDLLVAGTGGYVSPEVERIALGLLTSDRDNPAARYYAGLMYAQNDRPDRAFALWRPIVEGGDPQTLHYRLATSQIRDVAAQLALDYTPPDRRGPSPEDLAAAMDMPPEDRAAMIEGMVATLSDRLATQGGPPQDWARLITALTVLGDNAQARAILAEAEVVFGGDVQAVTQIRRAALEAGLVE